MKKNEKVIIVNVGGWVTWFGIALGLVCLAVGIVLTAVVIYHVATTGQYIKLLLLMLTVIPLIGSIAALWGCIADNFRIKHIKIQTPEEIAEEEAKRAEHEAEEAAMLARLKELEDANPHDFIMMEYPEGQLPEGITYQELEQECIRADINFGGSCCTNLVTWRRHCLTFYIGSRQAFLKHQAAIDAYEKTYGVKFKMEDN